MIKLTETTTEYLLAIPAVEKERAKKIQGRKWDSTRVCWVYPKTKAIYDQLMTEFGEDFAKNEIQRPMEAENRGTGNQPGEKPEDDLKRELEDIKASLQKMTEGVFTQDSGLLNQLTQQVNTLNNTLEITQIQLSKKEQEYIRLLNNYHLLEKQITNLQNANRTRLQNSDKFDRIVKEKAMDATSQDTSFCLMIENLPLDKTMVLEITNNLERKLRKELNENNRNSKLSDLIFKAKEEDKLPPEALDFAHLIRRERNNIAHGQTYSKTDDARVILCLFAAALLWPDLPE